MSLKGFHYFFITASLAMSLFVCVWALRHGGEGAGMWVLAAVCLVAAIGLGIYGVRVRRKLEYLGEPRPRPRLVD
jgi:hypothetical protein